MIVVISGAGGVGKGTLVSKLVERDPTLWLSRSWTTRPQRANEPDDAYRFVDRATFMENVDAGGFLEFAEVVSGHLYGTPTPKAPGGRDVILEIDVQGAVQVRDADPRALVVLITAPSRADQEARMRQRGDSEEHIRERLAMADREEEVGRKLADHVVINDDLDRAVAEVAAIVESHRHSRS